MTDLDRDVLAAKAAGLSYGQYQAMRAEQAQIPPRTPDRIRKKRPPKPKHYDDREVFRMWQARMSDRQIGASFGVSRTVIQRWRDRMEIPSLVTFPWISTEGFQLVRQDDEWVVLPPARVYQIQRRGGDIWALEYRVQPGFFKKRL